MAYKMRYQNTENFYVLSTNKTVDGKPMTGTFYRLPWEDGQTVIPLSYREAMRVARIRGLQLVPWKESKVYKNALVTKSDAIVYPEPAPEVVQETPMSKMKSAVSKAKEATKRKVKSEE